MDTTSASCRCIAGPDDAVVSARLASIEEHLDEIIRRLDELKNLLTSIGCKQPNHQHIAEG